MKSSWTFILGFVCLLFLSASCIRHPDGVASEKKMASVLADLELSEAWLQTTGSRTSDSDREALLGYVIEKHGLSRQDFDSTMNWYLRNPDAYYELCEVTEKELKKRQKSISGKGGIEVEGSDLWPYSRHLILLPVSDSDGLSFSVPITDPEKGSSFLFKMLFLSQIKGQANLAIEYSDGTNEFLTKKLSNTKRLEMKILSDTSRSVARVYGNLNLDNFSKSPIWGDSIVLSALPFDSTTYYNRHSQRFLSVPSRKIVKKASEPTDSLISQSRL